MTTKELLALIEGENMRASACGNSCLDAHEIKETCLQHGFKTIAERIDVNGSPWAAECEIKKELNK